MSFGELGRGEDGEELFEEIGGQKMQAGLAVGASMRGFSQQGQEELYTS